MEKLEQNEVFLLIHRSTPVAEIRPTSHIKTFSEVTEQDIESASVQDMSDDLLTREELNYYLSLP